MKLIPTMIFLIFTFGCGTIRTVEKKSDPEMFANLGDGIHSEHFYPIVEKLVKRKAGLKERIKVLNDYDRAKKESLKSWFSSMTETQFSNLLEKIARANNLNQAAVYDRFGIAVGYTQGTFDKDLDKLPLFYSTTEAEDFLKIKSVTFKKIDSERFIAIRPIKTNKDEAIGYSVVSFSTNKFQRPKTYLNK